MDDTLLRAFLDLAKSQNFSLSARNLGASQSSLSKKIRRLEDLIGAPLFVRNTHGVMLSSLGLCILEDVQKLVHEQSRILEYSRRLASGKKGHLRIGLTFSAIPLISALLPAFQQRYEGCSIKFEDMSSSDQENALLSHNLDIGFMRTSSQPGLAFTHMAYDELVFLTPKAIKTYQQGNILQTQGLPLIRFKRNFSANIYDRTDSILSAFDLKDIEIQWFNEAISALQMVMGGLACAIIHRSCLNGLSLSADAVTLHHIHHPASRWSVAIAVATKVQNPMTTHFVKFFQDHHDLYKA
ncbi:MAG: LysR family transcriptional regulator [Acetobacter sp.]|jgi:DNA-binding transcriptional LysR family regulator|nr:LysR family transcriptional regulator [Acetobacter sp.]MCH4062621.1 LysR family transcriptional regulator [Acetobacter sp.]MCH4088533.1 LysR family transcriptional regulator [Acetobacter sp.]MCI1294000.1 LysR family transcriptional regulator [Acetobacter sp.]MCI1320609.1 LysR family transcriptional regulator [Acetobacter sp.]